MLLPVSEIKLPLSGSVPSRAVVDLRRYHFDSDPLVVDTGTAAVGVTPDAALVEALQQLVRSRLAPYETPKDIEFVDTLPMTATGKLQRNVLKQLEIDRAARAGVSA